MKRRHAVLSLVAACGPLSAMPARSQLPGSALARILASGRLRVGVTLGTPPYIYRNADGDIVGSDVDVIRLVAVGLEVLPVFMPMAAAERINAVREGRVDLVMGIAITPQRARRLLFTTPYMQQDYGVATLGALQVRRPADFSGRIVAFQEGSEAEAIAREFLPADAEFRPFPNIAEAGEALVRRQVHAMITRRPAVRDLAQRHPSAGVVYRFTLTGRWMSMGVAFGEHDLLRSINTLLFQARENGRLAAITEVVAGYSAASLPAF